MQQERIIILDFGGQYKQLIARRVRECNVYCEIHPHTLKIEKIKEMNPRGIILTGGPAPVSTTGNLPPARLSSSNWGSLFWVSAMDLS